MSVASGLLQMRVMLRLVERSKPRLDELGESRSSAAFLHDFLDSKQQVMKNSIRYSNITSDY
jgi:hypothetical protein